MLSIGAMKSGQESYYQRLAAEDYYLEGGEPPGAWLGGAAPHLGLGAQVAPSELSSLFQGFSPTGRPLVQNSGKANRQPGWDLTFSAPKSVSVLWSQLEGAQQRAVGLAHEQAVRSALAYIERELAFSRIGKGGQESVPVRLLVAAFEHACSRALDPQLHTHCLVLNLGIDAQGVARSILSKPLYEAKMLVGAYYRMELARLLQQTLGVAIERPLNRDGKPQPWFEIQGVSKSILSHFSQRRAAIEAELGKRGLESASAAAFAALATRQSKTVVPARQQLYQRWKEEGLRLGFSPDQVLHSPGLRVGRQAYQRLDAAIEEAVAEITFSDNAFSQEELLRRTLEAASSCAIPADLVAQAVQEKLADESAFVSLGVRHGKPYWTTSEVLAVEQEFLASVDALRHRTFAAIADPLLEEALAKRYSDAGVRYQLDPEQQQAVRYITQGPGAIKVVSGFAGTGKTDMLLAAKEALEAGGYRVIGTALAGVAARSLQQKAGIDSATVRLREYQLYPTLGHVLKHHARQLARAAFGKSTHAMPRLVLDPKTVLVIDEAGMVGTRDFALLAKAVVEQGGTIVAIGDERQLSSIERGGCFAHLVKTVPGVRLNEIRRQTDAADREAVKRLAAGESHRVLQLYAEKGQLYVARDDDEAQAELVRQWARSGGLAAPGAHRIFAGTRAEVERFNRLCQWERAAAGQVDPRERVEHEGQVFMVGDRVRFSTACRPRGIQKGETGTIIACKDGFAGRYVAVARHLEQQGLAERSLQAVKHHAKQLVAAALGKRTEKLPPRKDVVLVPLKSLNPRTRPYQGLALDYAMTTHLGQGQTVEHAYVFLSGKMTDRELSYVQGSRHKEKLFLYCQQRLAGRHLTELAREHCPLRDAKAEPADAVPEYSALARQMAISRAKELALSAQVELGRQSSHPPSQLPPAGPQLERM